MPHLVNLQNGEHLEIPTGESLIGRGPLLKVADKRVSRNHAALRLEDGILKICPKHKNPMFHKTADGASYSILARDQWQELRSQDCFSLLPNDLEFRVEGEKDTAESLLKDDVCHTSQSGPGSRDIMDDIFGGVERSDKDATSIDTNKSKERAEKMQDAASLRNDPPTVPTLELVDDPPLNAASPTPQVAAAAAAAAPQLTSITSQASLSSSLSTSSSSSSKRRMLPAWLQSISADDLSATPPPPPAKKQRTAASPTAAKPATPGRGRINTPATKTEKASVSKTAASKRANTAAKATSPAGVPLLPNSPVKDVDRLTAVKTGDDDKEDVKPTASDVPKAGDHSPKKAGGNDKPLPLCPYGSKCYRKNPAHLKQYSHDPTTQAALADSEGEDSSKPVCPYGSSCYRKNTAHFVEFSHSASPVRGAGSRRSKRRRKGGAKPSALSGDSDDDGEPNTYDYNDSFIDNDDAGSGSSTSYVGESSDSDWAPAAGRAMEDNQEEGEDVAELLSDAQAFIKNKKMRS